MFNSSMNFCSSSLVREGNETFLIRVWKHFSNRHVLKLWDWWWYVMGQKRLFVSCGLDCYKWYESQGGVPARALGPKRGGMWNLISIGEGNEG